MAGTPPRYRPPLPAVASLFRRPAKGTHGDPWSRLSPSEQRSLGLPAPPAPGRYFRDPSGAIVAWYPAGTPEEVLAQARARLHYRVVVGNA